MQEIFLENKTIIVFLHVISAVVWVGGMIAMRFAAHQSFMTIESPQKRLEHIAHALKRLFTIVFPFVIILIITAVFMLIGYDIKNTDFNSIAHAKEGIWVVMFISLMVMISRRNKGVKFLNSGDTFRAKEQIEIIGKYMVPINIILGICAIFLGTLVSSSI
ncbi:hypothetical protein [Sulfurimonas sp.]|uniref:hypothetical protein n=1 Tax=Sulfurimonas sp. TaxID=2022749 RepID=UPI00260F7996|nr:hypothetical protein [Sulfurimonas sp.]MCW8895600.1 hypothetical protein [Sulfurimonas sp.]MCW9067150.1 hypothetical protein [Sulfurimonas sp.]